MIRCAGGRARVRLCSRSRREGARRLPGAPTPGFGVRAWIRAKLYGPPPSVQGVGREAVALAIQIRPGPSAIRATRLLFGMILGNATTGIRLGLNGLVIAAAKELHSANHRFLELASERYAEMVEFVGS
jgi:hypothetical protein